MSRGANWCPNCGTFYPAEDEHECANASESASAGSGTRLSAARIEAARRRLAGCGYPVPTRFVEFGLAAADVVEASEVARLRTALTDLLALGSDGALHEVFGHTARYRHCSVDVCVKERDLYKRIRAALAESVPSPQKDATK